MWRPPPPLDTVAHSSTCEKENVRRHMVSNSETNVVETHVMMAALPAEPPATRRRNHPG